MCQVLPQAPIVPVTSAEHGSEASAELPVRGASALGVSSGGNPVIDLTTSLETGPGSGPSSRTSSPRQPSSPGDTTSDATIKSSSVGVATMDPAILHAESAGALVDILRGQYQPPNSSAELAQLRVDLHSAEASNASLQKRLGSSLDQVAQLQLQLETSDRPHHFPPALTASGAEFKQARAAQTAEVTATQSALHAAELMIKSRDEDITALSRSIVERDEAYKILQGVSAKHFQQLQEIVLSLDDNGSHKLRHAKKTIDEMRETILCQKRVISRQGFVPMHDLHMAAAAGAGLDVPGMDPASLKLNARLCRLLTERFLEVMRIPDGEDRVVELRICSRQSGSAGVQTSASDSAAVPTPCSGSAAALPPSSSSASTQVPLRHRPSRSIEALRRVWKDNLTPSRACESWPTLSRLQLRPYGQPLPGEEGYEEAAALIGPPDDRLLAASDSELTVPPARPLPRQRKTAKTAPPRVAFRCINLSKPIRRVSCVVDPTGRSSSVLIVDEYSSSDDSTELISVIPPVPTPSPVTPLGTPVSLPAQLSSAKGPSQVPWSSVARLLACKSCPVVPSRAVAAPAGLTSPSGRPLRTAAATASQVNAQLLENLGTSDNVVLGLDGGSTGHKFIPPSSVGSLSHPLEFASDSADDDQAAETSSANTASTAASNAPVGSSSSLVLSRLAQLFGSDDESDDDDDKGSDSADVSAVSTVVSSPLPPPHGKIQSYLAAGQVPPGPPPTPTSGGSSPQVPTPSKKHRKKHKHKHKHKRKHKHKHRSSSPSGGSGNSDSARPKKRRKAVPGKSQAQASAVAESGDPESGRAVPSGTSTTGSQRSTSRNSALASNSAPQSTSVVSSAPASDTTRRSAEVVLPAQQQVPLAQLRTRAMQSASRDSRITPQLARLRTLPFFHAGAERCWAGILSCQSGRVPLESSGGAKPRIRATLSTLAGVRSFVDVFNPRHPFQQLRRMLPDLPTFYSPSVLAEARSRLVCHTRPSSLMETLGDLWTFLHRGPPNSAADLASHTRFFVAMCERTHWLVDASVLIGLHPAFDPSIPPDELIAVYNVAKWLGRDCCLPEGTCSLCSGLPTNGGGTPIVR
ncbi:Hypothetical protein PHPALM_10228 [Phytophthora palmivora]|uniref:Uncharacterized protein n=1 Tax=Phytophthora palmivora TaxID=4796 RepID=A0A2P4Y5A0_9STRA|nr:Hypothetical protein PHPALM_10228 [Phytophthora palmivora]